MRTWSIIMSRTSERGAHAEYRLKCARGAAAEIPCARAIGCYSARLDVLLRACACSIARDQALGLCACCCSSSCPRQMTILRAAAAHMSRALSIVRICFDLRAAAAHTSPALSIVRICFTTCARRRTRRRPRRSRWCFQTCTPCKSKWMSTRAPRQLASRRPRRTRRRRCPRRLGHPSRRAR